MNDLKLIALLKLKNLNHLKLSSSKAKEIKLNYSSYKFFIAVLKIGVKNHITLSINRKQACHNLLNKNFLNQKKSVTLNTV